MSKKSKITLSQGSVKNKTDEEQLIDVEHGFDRGVDFTIMKDKLIKDFEAINSRFANLDIDDSVYIRKRRMIFHRMIYCLIALIQLRCGSRICEAVSAFKKFITSKNFDDKVFVKIAKSESIKYTKDTKEQYKTKARYRKMIFPTKWIKIDHIDILESYSSKIPNARLQKRVLDYLLKYFNCNTHSLRYAFINYMLFIEKKEPSLIAKFVGHVNMNQIVTYTQHKQVDKIFDLDI